MRALLTLALLSLTFAGLGLAQEDAPRRIDELKARLNLSSEQVDQLRPIVQEEVRKLRDVQDKYEGKTARRDRLRLARDLRNVQQDAEKRIRPILTKDQQAEWKKIQQERREELKERAAERKGR